MKNFHIFIGFLAFIMIFSLTNKKVIDDNINDKLIEDKVFNYEDNTISDDYTFKDYYLLFDEYSLSTNNFIKVFSYFNTNNYEYRIIEIIPYINPEYIDLFKDKKFLYYSKDLNDILNKFSNDYLSIYNDNNKDITINQINIQTIRINTANKFMIEFLKEYNSVKYSVSKEGKFRKL